MIIEDDKKFAAAAINRFGTRDHPEASAETIDFFAPAYVRACVHAAWIAHDIAPIYRQNAARILAHA